MDQTAVTGALHDWLHAATGLEVQLQEQDGPQPSTDYCTLRIPGLRGDGTLDTKTRRLVPNAPPGQELEVTYSSRVFITVTVQAYTEDSTGNEWAVNVLQRAKKQLELDTVRAALKQHGVAVFSVAEVRNLNALAGLRWKGRASMELTVNVIDTVTERTTYIQTTGITVIQGG